MEWDWKRRETGQEKADTGLFSWQKRQLFTGKVGMGLEEERNKMIKGRQTDFWQGVGGEKVGWQGTGEGHRNGQ